MSEEITTAELAYRLWTERGRPMGTAEADWIEAERQLSPGNARMAASDGQAVDAASKESFPASDPPGSQLQDRPPSNADDKWKAAGVDRTKKRRPGDGEPPVDETD